MPRPCSLCQHPSREAIDQALAAKEPYRTIAERFGTSPAALHRHQAHTQQTPPLVAGATKPEASALVDTAQRLHTTACRIRQQTVEVRSLHDPKRLQNVEEIAQALVEVTALLVQVTAGSHTA